MSQISGRLQLAISDRIGEFHAHRARHRCRHRDTGQGIMASPAVTGNIPDEATNEPSNISTEAMRQRLAKGRLKLPRKRDTRGDFAGRSVCVVHNFDPLHGRSPDSQRFDKHQISTVRRNPFLKF